jgi:isoleucyl-tRNA synthetase
MTMFAEVHPQANYPRLEADIAQLWKDRAVFAETNRRQGPSFVFYEGPPTANGKPAMHHVLARSFKDLFPRYKIMKGYRVVRKGGWDTHGLPVEISVEKRLGLSGRNHGATGSEMAEFNRLCRESVFTNIQDWNVFTERMGFWVDLTNPYITYENNYIESVWNLLKRLWQRGLIEQDYKVVPLSPRISSTLSAAEISDGYRDVDDPSVYVRLPVQEYSPAWRQALDNQGVSPEVLESVALLVWTTTPWTLPTNTACAVNPELSYALVNSPQGYLVVAEAAVERLSQLYPNQPVMEVVATFSGQVMEYSRYQPPFPEVFAELKVETPAHIVLLADFVTAEDGSGLAHEAPAYGADDLVLCRKYGLPVVFGVDDHGVLRVTSERGKFFKDADKGLIRLMRERNVLYHGGTVRHSYPFHDRTGDPILYFAKKSWFVRTMPSRQALVDSNQRINWYPEHIKNGRFGNWLANNIDWAISRERYWGTPLPFWVSEDGSQTICMGSVAELSRYVGRDLGELDLHRPFVDDIVFEHQGQSFRRVPEVLDVWFDSGAMPYAQWQLLLGDDGTAERGGEAFADQFPADFICEAIDQTRGWFYSLHAISTLLYNQPCFQNVICLGHLVDEKGQKMSKSVGNIVEPLPMFDRYGADAVRWYMFTASEPGDTKRFSERLVAEGQRGCINTLWNTYAFFVLYANLDNPDLAAAPAVAERPEIDRWLLSRLAQTVATVDQCLEHYDARGAAKALERYVDELSNWYVRRNRRRFWKSEADADKLSAYASLYEALVTLSKLAAPFVPFLAEALYQNLVYRRDATAPNSVHLAQFPVANPLHLDAELMQEMQAVMTVVDLGRAARGQSGLKTRQPLTQVLLRCRNPEDQAALLRLSDQIAEELNVKRVEFLEEGAELLHYQLKPNLPVLGRKHGKLIPDIKAALVALSPPQAAAAAQALRQNTTFTLSTTAGDLELSPQDVLVDAKSPENYAALEQDGFLVAIDTHVTPELEREGQVRDLLRGIQQARKDAGFAVSDHIHLHLALDESFKAAIGEWLNIIKAETLADSIVFDLEGAGFIVDLEEGGAIGVTRV